ncbi:MAG TPA: glycosyltransferase family 9 protein [Candidatus Ratteibacteria bacterium]|jgi:heptosyltransferase-2|uniref:Lipopolysaccharide core heptosyltransferase RfaQ n=1 Tax=candidate division TA06 bacterium ADurb.Bin131 TaxID=1852827 RepID=A0A1V6CE26_UNCT6|nr:MAG: Lipopolysaccharide core heptosyltransferase RfaQ [candidate division TA06 bacterium ADurb.Bin131]HOC03460.1 glycosyltransferase family 9 protein [bacterium]HRS05613.1 glycosyltransferase family 9 protein [Candidatus Ratteibacteria bacterium]HON06004.1 glycosyltransferase family 9 protein [bacterium]HQL65049.1 glycosyltransferase family 9 protein [bacterium]
MKFYQPRDYPPERFEKFYRDPVYLKLRGKVKSIMVFIGESHYGDFMLSMPFFQALKEMFPGSKIIFVGHRLKGLEKFSDILPFVDIYYELRMRKKREVVKKWFSLFCLCLKENVNFLIDTQRYSIINLILAFLPVRYRLGYGTKCFFSNWKFSERGRKDIHDIFQLLALCRVLGKKDVKTYVDIKFPREYEEKASKILSPSGDWVCIFPGASEKVKCWPSERFSSVADALYKYGYSILLLGSFKEKKLLMSIAEKMTHKPTVPVLIDDEFGKNPVYAALFCSKSKLCISNESGGLHFAGLVNTPIIGIFGLKNPVKWGPLSPRSIALYKGLGCSPCKMRKTKVGCPYNRRCLLDISVEEVIEAAKESLGIA